MSRSFSGYAASSPKATLRPFKYTSRPLQDYDVDLQITHCGVCHSDLHSINNDWGGSKYPLLAGHEVIGKISAIGTKVQNLKIGDRVGVGPTVGGCSKCANCKLGEQNLCSKGVGCYNSVDHTGTPTYGGFADGMRVDSRFVYPIPEGLPSQTAAPLLCAGITVFSPLQRWVKAKQVVGVIGVGGLGHLAIQFARAMGCQTVALSSSPSKEAEAMELGAHYFVDTSKREEMGKWRGRIDFLLCTANVVLPWNSYLGLLKTDGRFCLVGIPPGKIELNPAQLVMRRLSVCGSPIGSSAEYRTMLEFAARNNIVAKTELFQMKDVNQALERVHKNEARYRCVLVADETTELRSNL